MCPAIQGSTDALSSEGLTAFAIMPMMARMTTAPITMVGHFHRRRPFEGGGGLGGAEAGSLVAGGAQSGVVIASSPRRLVQHGARRTHMGQPAHGGPRVGSSFD